MDTRELKYVVGKAEKDSPAIIRLYGYINEQTTKEFNDEFLFLQDYIKPSKICVSINSEGGSVLHGMGTYSIISQCPIEVDTIIEGVAASMASVIWAAGAKSYMRDYSILMIHNPFLEGEKVEDLDPDSQQIVKAFQKQIETIYHKRFGLPMEKVREIMSGAEGCDGTYFDAKAAVEAGIIPAENVLKTSKQAREKVKSQIENSVNAVNIRSIMENINAELGDIQLIESASSIFNKGQIKNSVNMENEKNFAFESVCAQLGLEKASDVPTVINTISGFQQSDSKLKEVQSELDALKIQKEGVDAQLKNVSDELQTVKDELKKYKDAEEAQFKASVEEFIENAINDGKIAPEAKEKWVEMAQGNFDIVKDTLNSIPKRDKISNAIAKDPANIKDAAEGLTEAERKMKEAVDEIVGKDFKFNKLD